MALLNVTDVQDHFGHDDLGDVQTYIDAATDLIEQMVGPVVPREITGEVLRDGVLRHAPVLSVDVVTLNDSPVTYHDIDLATGESLRRLPYGTRITYTAGYETVPAAIRLAALYIVAHAVESTRGAVPVPFQSGTDESFVTSRGFFVPARAMELLRPYLLGPRA